MQILCEDTDTRERALAGWRTDGPEARAAAYWSRLVLVGEAPASQYDALRRRPLASGHDLPEAQVALCGQGFHGQRDRIWRAEAGNLHLSVSVPLDLPAGPVSLVWTMLPAVAVMQALRALSWATGPEPAPDTAPSPSFVPDLGIKWVNDILWKGRKVGGVLSSVIQENGRLRRGHLGIGLNLEIAPVLDAAGPDPVAACLADWLQPGVRSHGRVLQTLLGTLAREIQRLHEGAAQRIVASYRADSLVVGRQVRVVSDPPAGPARPIARGRVRALQDDLSLLIEGRDEPVREGRLVFLDEDEAVRM